MYYVIAFITGVIIGGASAALLVMDWYRKVKARERASDLQATRARQLSEQIGAKEGELGARESAFSHARTEFDQRVISYDELQGENHILKRDLQNVDVNLRKLELDAELREQKQVELDRRSADLAKRYLGETVKSVVASVGPSNFTTCKQRLLDVIGRVRSIGFDVPDAEESRLLADLRREFEKAVRAAFEREEQQRIAAQIREEERLKREIERELKQLERERAAIQAALDQALAEAHGQHTAEVQRLQTRLAEAEEKSKRTMSMAQQTKAGHVYVLSNIGTFGADVFKVGMTRRLKPQERVDELSCAAVPFPFDVHMLIRCLDAPALENAIHRALHKHRVNRANPRKEFFKINLESILKIVHEHHGEVEFQAAPDAAEYRQSLAMSEADAEFIERVFEAAHEEEPIASDEV